jgi:hypothetical protein
MIANAIYTIDTNESILITYDDGSQVLVPAGDAGHRQAEIDAWLAEGNTISPYVPPPVPTDDEQATSELNKLDTDHLLHSIVHLIAEDLGVTSEQYKIRLHTKVKEILP